MGIPSGMKQIPGFPHYYISTDGMIWSLYSNKFLKTCVCKNTGYEQLTLCENKKKKLMSVHRLVAMTYIPNPNNYPMINHKDEIRTNNNVENLEWCTSKYNNNYGDCKKKLVETIGIEALRESASYARSFRLRKVQCIETGEVYESTCDAARRIGLKSHSGIVLACNGTYGTSAGYHWRYYEDVV